MHLILHTLCTPLSIHQYYAITCLRQRNIVIRLLLTSSSITDLKSDHGSNNRQCSNHAKLQDNCFSIIRFLSDSGFSGSESRSVNKRSDLFCR
ncbi:hypothetical protein DO470_24550 [Salmonella enterica]|uniref:Uncharacterized protein n=4 Tax=Salmonella enterica TaxID=28901 RepID=A0A614W881_SALET|nr:hypothetical protein AM468_01620 [Escherichia coli]EAA6652097.1 hypothetical protein [Salmonella enterica subsp. enterica serovar Reading]EAB4860314.1 hypothetical protein [Salmonella enterica]EAV0424378.1 hypothetical protein [Salmonella enterica subsp. enterica serovar Heidelberg]EBG7785737.1 hypothetical protein [Salmonella enterica subsp. enterica serovar Kentucky]EBK2281060.1 hypothetical protein [Salmonella enterica subsp. enterica serovar Typhimurium]EBO2610827.1 hypothetical protei